MAKKTGKHGKEGAGDDPMGDADRLDRLCWAKALEAIDQMGLNPRERDKVASVAARLASMTSESIALTAQANHIDPGTSLRMYARALTAVVAGLVEAVRISDGVALKAGKDLKPPKPEGENVVPASGGWCVLKKPPPPKMRQPSARQWSKGPQN